MDFDDLEAREDELRRDIEEYNREKEHIKALIGKVGGKAYSKRENVLNSIFLIIIIFVFSIL